MDSIFILIAKYLFIFIIGLDLIYFAWQSITRIKGVLMLAIIYLPLTYVVAKIASHLYFDPRPFVINHFQPLLYHTADNGFPSDHMLLSSALATLLFAYHRKLGVLAWILAGLVGLSRVYVGIHHFTDILGSALIAIITMWVVKQYLIPKAFKNN